MARQGWDEVPENYPLIQKVVSDGLTSADGWLALIVALVSIATSILCSGAIAFFKKKGENLATKEDFNKLLEQVKETTIVTEQVKSQHAQLIAKIQVNATVLSGNRQQWINKLREDLSEFICSIVILSGDTATAIDHDKAKDLVEKIILLQIRIGLLTNPNEADHARLATLTKALMLESFSERSAPNAISSLIDDLTKLSQTILKREWERVKQGT